MATLSLIQSWETDRHVEGQSEGRMKEDLERKLLCWEGFADRGGCACSLLHAWVLPSMGFHWNNESQHGFELSCLNLKSLLQRKSTEAEHYLLLMPWVFMIVHEYVWS